MLTIWLLLFGAVLLLLVMADRAVSRLPLSPAVIYLAVGAIAGLFLGAPASQQFETLAPAAAIATEVAVLLSLFAVGLRLRVPPSLKAWRVALWMAGPGMLVMIGLATLAAYALLGLPWSAALLLAAVLAPTDPVLASEVQIRSDEDRDAVRLSLTVEGALNDGSALPVVMLALGLMGLHSLGTAGLRWVGADLIWPIGGGALLGIALGRFLGQRLKMRIENHDRLARDELLYIGTVAMAYGLARATGTSAFLVVFATGATLLWPFHDAALEQGGQDLTQRLQAFGARIERLVEAATVLAVGVALNSIQFSWNVVGFGLLIAFIARPLSVMAVVRLNTMRQHQRRLMAWFGIRGIGSLFYLAFVLEHGVTGATAATFISATLIGIALSIVLHGVSASPLMMAYQKKRGAPQKPPVP